MNTKPNFIIVGGGLAGAIAAQTLREEGFDGRITLLGQEPNAPYERPPLSKDYLQGKADRDSIFVHTEPWYAEHGVDLSLGAAVTSLDPAARTVTTNAGAQLHYDKLLLATGSKPRRLEVPGADLDGVYYLRNVEDSERIKIDFTRAKRVVIIGAGWIGLETAAAARAAGLDVTLLVSGDLPLQRVLGPEVAPIFAELHRSHGVDLRYRTTAAELTGRHRAVTGVILSDGTRDRCRHDHRWHRRRPSHRTRCSGRSQDRQRNRCRRAPAYVRSGHLRRRRHRPRIQPALGSAYSRRALGERPTSRRRRRQDDAGPGRSRPTTVVLLHRSVRPQHGVHRGHRPGRLRPGHLPPVRRTPLSSIVFWLYEQRVQAGMNINIWDVAEDIERLVQSARPINVDDLADPDIPLASLF